MSPQEEFLERQRQLINEKLETQGFVFLTDVWDDILEMRKELALRIGEKTISQMLKGESQ
jgi:hypothetical protein